MKPSHQEKSQKVKTQTMYKPGERLGSSLTRTKNEDLKKLKSGVLSQREGRTKPWYDVLIMGLLRRN